jgi:hypothetical protein
VLMALNENLYTLYWIRKNNYKLYWMLIKYVRIPLMQDKHVCTAYWMQNKYVPAY